VGQSVQQFQRQGQPVGLFGVHAEIDVVFRRDQGQPLNPRIQLVPHARFLGRLIAGAQGRQLDRDAVAGLRSAHALGVAPHLADGLDGPGIDFLVADGVLAGAGTLAQHVETAQPAFAGRAFQRPLDRATDHELFTHHPHCRSHGLADHRLTDAARHPAQEAGQVALGVLVDLDQLAGQHQPPCRGVDEQAFGLAQMLGPVGRADLLRDQPVARLLVGNTQQGLGHTHQGQTLAGAQRKLLQEALDHALAMIVLAGPLHQFDGLGGHRLAFGRGQRHLGQQFGHNFMLITELAAINLVPLGEARGQKRGSRHTNRIQISGRG